MTVLNTFVTTLKQQGWVVAHDVREPHFRSLVLENEKRIGEWAVGIPGNLIAVIAVAFLIPFPIESLMFMFFGWTCHWYAHAYDMHLTKTDSIAIGERDDSVKVKGVFIFSKEAKLLKKAVKNTNKKIIFT